jgi:SPP1 family predicted phage head-tail adaptor
VTVIGELRKRIELQAPVDTIDAYGQATRSWTTYATVYASVEPASGQENTIAEAMQVQQTHTITIRYRSDVLATHRALFSSRQFNFQFVRNIDERNRWLEITATERTGA